MQDFTTASRGRTVSRSFSHVPHMDMPRSSFDRSSRRTMTMDADFLNPIYCEEIYPGDTMKLALTSFVRLATPLKPIMDNMYLDTFWFFVPNRITQDNWKKLMGEQTNPGDSIDFLTPIATAPPNAPIDGYQFGSLQDHMGLIPGVSGYSHNNLPMRAYNFIWNEWFRDQDVQDSVPVPKDDGNDNPSDFVLLRRGKRHDYFTSARPFSQKGPDVLMPLGTSAPLQGVASLVAAANTPTFTAGGAAAQIQGSGGVGPQTVQHPSTAPAGAQPIQWANPGLSVDLTGVTTDLSAASSATLNEWRLSIALQTFYERNARGGTRYVELLRANFGVVSPDFRQQRPEYLGGGSSRISVHPVSATNSNAFAPVLNVGDLGAFVTGGDTGRAFSQSFTEHGFVIGLACVRADITYQRGLDRMWSRSDRESYYFPDFAHLGEQEVLSKELYLDGTAADDDVFGYQERFAELRYKQSSITGKFRSEDPQSLDVWTLSQDFGSNRPTLSPSFIESNTPIDRVVAVPSEPDFLADFWFQLHHARPIPTYGVPRLSARF